MTLMYHPTSVNKTSKSIPKGQQLGPTDYYTETEKEHDHRGSKFVCFGICIVVGKIETDCVERLCPCHNHHIALGDDTRLYCIIKS